MQYEEVVKMIEESNKKVDEVLKAAKLERHEKQPMSLEKLRMVLDYIIGGIALTFGFIVVLLFTYYLCR